MNSPQGTQDQFHGAMRLTGNGSDRLSLVAGEVTVAEYVYRPRGKQQDSPRPYFHPLRTLAGMVVTDFGPADHPWHQGLSFALPVVGGENFWGGPSYLPGRGYVQLANNGSQRHRRFSTFDPVAGDRGGPSFVEELDWVSQAGAVLLTEVRRISASVLDEARWRLHFATELRNVSAGAIRLGSPTTRGRPDAGYGGLFWRAPRSFLGGSVHTQAGEGGEELLGMRAPWMSFTGTHDSGERSTVMMVDRGLGADVGPPWFVRTSDYPGMGPAPFFHEEFELPPGETFAASYDVTVTG
ncbi:PmoA family protein [Arthrobacter sp. GMC3]|uniref:DUF6807 domain-containing protein n=1 Tax=Arthrobacter sp. GMC3 TaxID=2058894 RepID=UPI0011B04B4A|nr:PmoA family protein [Arthrobacter sp. GMC3]